MNIGNKKFYHTIGQARATRMMGITAVALLSLFLVLSAFPIIDNTDNAEGTAGTVEVPSITITSASNAASVDVMPTSSTGTFAVSDSSSRLAFSVSTSNYTGYNLTIKGSDNTGQLTNASYNDTLDSITAATDANTFETDTTSTYVNKWGYKPNVLNSTANSNFLPAPTTTETLLDNQTAATTQNYTIDVAARVDYTKPVGTYTNTYILTATANYVAYHIEYWDLAGISSTTLNDGGITWSNPASGTAKVATYNQIAEQNSSTNTAASITLAPISTTTGSVLATPTRHTYTFAGWCRNSTNHSNISVNDTVATTTSSNKVTAYNNPSTMCNGSIPDYNTSTDNFIKAGDTTFKLDPTLDNTNIKLYAVWKPTSFATAGIAANANMQSMTNDICKATTPNQFTTLKDSRDSSSYVVVKLMDGNCWMADNLDLNLNNSTVRTALSNSNTNVPSNTTGTNILNALRSGGGTQSNGYAQSSWANGASDWTTTNSYTYGLANRSGTCQATQYMCQYPYQKGTYGGTTYAGTYTNTKVISLYGVNFDSTTGEGLANVTYNFGPGGYKIGTYYNYCAASAGSYCYSSSYTGSANASYDICPKGWKMPSGDQANGSYYYLRNKISNITTSPNAATNLLSLQAMLSTPVSGAYNSGTAYRQGTYGFFWSSTYYSATNMYRMYVSGTGVYPQSYDSRYDGRSVRCLAQ